MKIHFLLAACLLATPVWAQHPDADPKAYALLGGASANRQILPPDLTGFDADLAYFDGEKKIAGKLEFRREGKTQIALEGLNEDDKGWLEDRLLSLIGHRRGGDFAKGDGRFPLSLGDENGFGQLVKLNDSLKSEYRVKDGKVTEVTRTMGETKFTISVMQFQEAEPGKYLAPHFTVAYRDAKTGGLQSVEGYRDSYQKIEGAWLPTGRTVWELNEATTPRVRGFRLSNFRVLKSKTP